MVIGGHKEGKNEGKPETVRMPHNSSIYDISEEGRHCPLVTTLLQGLASAAIYNSDVNFQHFYKASLHLRYTIATLGSEGNIHCILYNSDTESITSGHHGSQALGQ